MTLRHIKIYEAVYRHSSITRAADELHLAQPSVSLAVRELEEYYGIRLFERIGRRIYPTEAGKEFYGYARHIVSLFEDMETKVRNWDTLGKIRIGTSITIGTHILPVLIREFQKEFPGLKVEAVVSKSSDIEQHILDNTIDLGLIESTPGKEEIQVTAFMQDSLCAIAPCGHPLTAEPFVTLSRLADYPLLMREKGSAGRELLEASFSLLQISVHPIWESASTQAIVRGVAEGLGVAVLPRMLVEKDIREGNVKQLSLTPPIRRDLNIIWHKSKYLTPNMLAFIRLCREYGQKAGAPGRSSG
ncbi:MAG TPA: LysR family transcriptional regulator [Candidatus Eisenbergiella merdipullorum]|uniref:LysR family transcriptional regulator n=1 Tax=Candidatus Eisenbergiella merdipullorum TaxID=2838553 RepID=A0A9D2I9X3_9FIRM|nr:LysR family transcriptional regulator [Candidatus Eisenbergiella merdipullorum]